MYLKPVYKPLVITFIPFPFHSISISISTLKYFTRWSITLINTPPNRSIPIQEESPHPWGTKNLQSHDIGLIGNIKVGMLASYLYVNNTDYNLASFFVQPRWIESINEGIWSHQFSWVPNIISLGPHYYPTFFPSTNYTTTSPFYLFSLSLSSIIW